MPRATSNGASLYYQVHGSTGDPVLLVMGLGSDLHFWERQIPAFAARHRVIALDNRGIGRSDKPPGPYTVPMLAADAARVLDAAAVDRAHVVGLSMGGMIAQELALAHADRVGALALAATYAHAGDDVKEASISGATAMGLPTARELLSGAPIDARTIDIGQVARFLIPLTFSPEFIARDGAWLAAALERSASYGFSVDAFLAQLRAAVGHDRARELAEIRAPTLILTGTADRLVAPRYSEELAALIPGAVLERVEGGSHAFNLEMPERFNRLVLDFLAAHPL